MTTARARWRRIAMQTSTLLGKPAGFFTPYRYASSVAPPPSYPELEALIAAEEPRLAAVLAAIEDQAAALDHIAEDAEAPAPRWGQGWFPGLDAAALYALIRARAPSTIIEVGSGHSTRFMARAVADAGLDTKVIAIDPEPRAALGALPVDWRREMLSPAHLPLFAALGPSDIAFFDSSHILAPGTDVDLILNRILPVLPTGVLAHLHDVFLPDSYPASWAWRGYNEQNAVAGLLLGGAFRIAFASHYARSRMGAALRRPWRGTPESSLWLERVSAV